MHLSINIIGDAFADIYCYLGDSDLPAHGGDARLVQPIHTVAGGSGVNTATHLASLLRHFPREDAPAGPRAVQPEVALQTVINEHDDHGKLLASHARRHQFALINRRVSRVPSCYMGTDEAALLGQGGDKATGHCAVIVSKGDRSFMTHLGCMEDFRGSHVLTNFLESQDPPTRQHVHIAGYYNIAGFWHDELGGKLREMREIQTRTKQTLTISLVPQHDATNAWDGGLLNILPYIDFLILNEVEMKNVTKFPCEESDDGQAKLFQHAANFFRPYTLTCVIVTRGSNGAVAFHAGRMLHHQRTAPVIDNPTDPTGAGDAFAAGFLHGYLSHRAETGGEGGGLTPAAVKAGMQWACAAGTCSVMVQGASVPAKKDSVERILQKIIEQESNTAAFAATAARS